MDKLTLEPLTAAHGAELLALWQDEAVVRYTNMALPCTPEEAERRADTLARFDTFVLRQEGELVGIAGCPEVDRAARRFGVFYQLRPAFWGRGLGMQAVGQLLDFMAEKYGEVQLLAEVITKNTASEKILQHFQFTPCGEEPLERNGKHYTVRRYQKTFGPPRNRGEGNEHWRTAGSTDGSLPRRPKKNS